MTRLYRVVSKNTGHCFSIGSLVKVKFEGECGIGTLVRGINFRPDLSHTYFTKDELKPIHLRVIK